MEKLAAHYTREELEKLIGEKVTVQYIYDPTTGDYVGLHGIITKVLCGYNPPNIPASIDFDPTEQALFNFEVSGNQLPENISVLGIKNIIPNAIF